MADFFKGLTGGFQTGLQLGQQVRQRRMEDDLAQAYAKPEEFVDYTPEQLKQIQGLQAAGGYDVQAVPGAEGQAPTLRYTARPESMYYNDMGQPEAPIEIAPQRVQRYGGQTTAGQFDPTQLRGLQMQEAARVLGSYGDARGAAALETQADEMRRGLARDKRDEAAEARRVAREPLEIKQLENALVSQGLTIDEAKRVAAEQASITSAREKLQTLRKNGPLTAANIASVAGEFKLDPTKFLQAEDAVNTLEIKDLKRDLSKAAMGGDAALNKFLADKFDPDKSDNIKPMITKAKDGSFVVTYGDRVLPEYGAHKNMMSLVGGVINMIDQNPFATLTTLSTLETQAEARAASKASTNLSNVRAQGLAKDSATMAKLDRIDQQFEALTPAEQNGPAGRGLLMQRNNIVSGANKQVPVGAAPRAERPALTEAEVTTRAEKYVSTRQKNPDTGKVYTLDEAIEKVRGGPAAPGSPADARARLDAALGGGDPFAPAPAAAAPAAPAAPAAAAPAAGLRTTPVERNPYVDARGRPLANPPAGAPSVASTAVPAAATAVENTVGSRAAATRYLQAKIDRNEPLTATDRARAVQLGLVRQ